jgi:hypothetical protein
MGMQGMAIDWSVIQRWSWNLSPLHKRIIKLSTPEANARKHHSYRMTRKHNDASLLAEVLRRGFTENA